MALDRLVDSSRLNGALQSTADVIRDKTGGKDNISWDMDEGFSAAVEEIVTLSEGSDDATAAAGDILSGKTAYVKGEKVTGNIATKTASDMTVSGKTVTAPAGYYSSAQSKSVAVGTVTSGTANITSLTKTYNSTSGKFDITGSANVSAPSINTAGYVSSSEGTKNAKTGGATVNATIDKIVGSTSITGTTTKVPAISKQATPTGVTNAASGDATTTAPSSGVYVAVKSTANTGTLTATPSVTTAGYGDATNHGITGNTATVGAAESATTYVPVTTTSASVSGKTVSYGSGWITEGSKSVADGAYSADSSASSNSTITPSVGLDASATDSYGFTTTKPSSGTTGTNYLTVDPNASATAWSVTPRANITTAGYLDKGNKAGTAVSNTPTVAAGTNYYVPVVSTFLSGGGLSTDTNTNTVGTAPVVTVASSGTFKTSTSYGVTTTKPSGTDGTNYLTIDGSGSVTTTGKATSTVKVTRAAVTYSNGAGVIAANSGVSGLSSTNTGDITKDVDITPTVTDNFAPLYIPVVSAIVSGGGLSTSTNTNTVGTAPVVTVSSSGTFKTTTGYGVTTTRPSGTDGTNYLTIDGTGTVTTTGKATSTVKVARAAVTLSNSAGAIAANSSVTKIAAGDSGDITKDVDITPSITDSFAPLYIPVVSASFSGGGLSNTTNYSGTPTITLADGDDSNMDNIAIGGQDTDTYPYYFKVAGSTAKLTGSTKVTRAALTYTNSAGAIAAHSGTTALDSGTSSPSVTVNAASANTYVNIKGATVTQNAPTIDSATGLVTATASTTAGYTPETTASETLQLTIKAATTFNTSTSNQTIAAGTYLTGKQTFRAVTTSGIDAGNIKSGAVITVGDSASAGRIKNVTGTYTNDGTITAADVRSGKIGYSKATKITGSMADTSVSQGTTTVSGTTATRGTATWGTGYISSGSIGAATFANTATTGTTYVDISSTTDAPVLVSGDSLYINKGYTDNLKISLAKLVPDGASANLASGVILSGYSAYNNDGTLVAGNIPTKTSSDMTVSGKTVTAPAGYYASAQSKSVADGAYSADSSTSSNSTVTPSIGLDASATASYGFTTTAPTSGTSGTNYLTIDPGASATAWSVTPRAKITTAGYLATGNTTGTAVSQTPSIAAGTNYYVPVVAPSFSGGGLSNTTNYSGTPTITLATGSESNMDNITIGSKDTTNYPYYFKVAGSTAKLTGSTKVTRAAITYTNSAGAIAAHTDTSVLGSGTSSPSVTVNAASANTYVGLKGATLGASGTGSATTTVAPGTVSIAANTTSVSGKTRLALEPSTATSGIGTYYIAIKATAAANSTGTTSSISGTASATVSAAGYAPTTLTGSGSVTGTATAKTSAKDSSVYYIPVTSGVGAANSASATISTASSDSTSITLATSAPSSGNYYTLTANGSGSSKITTAGWMPTGALTAASTTKAYYVTKATGSTSNGAASATANAGTASITKAATSSATATAYGMDGGYYTDTSTSSYYVDCSASAGSGIATATGGSASASVTASSATVSAGYNPTAVTATTTASSTGTKTGNTATTTESTSSVSKKIYLKPAGITYDGGGLSNTTNYSGTPTVSLALDSQSTSGIAITDTAQTSGYYVKLTGSTAKMTGSTKVTRAAYTDTRTAGYLPARAATTVLASATSSPSVTVNAASKTRYLTLPTATFAKSGASVYCSAGGWVPTGSTSSVLATIGSGTITNNTTLPSGSSSSGTVNRGSYIKIGAGYYSADAYYLAQANSGTLTISASGTTSCNGYANVSVPAKTPAFDGGGLSGTATATGSNATISDSTNTSGISVTTACTATRAAVLYNGAVAGWVNVADNATALAKGTGAMTAKTYYINSVTLPKSKSFSIKVYTDSTNQVTFTFTTDADGNTTVTEG